MKYVVLRSRLGRSGKFKYPPQLPSYFTASDKFRIDQG